MKQKALVHAIPTDKPTFPCLAIGTPELGWRYAASLFGMKEAKYFNLYFTTDEEIKEGDWYLVPHNVEGELLSDKLILVQATKNFILNHYIKIKKDWYKKIVATTNPDLYFQPTEMKTWSDNSPNQIPQSFIQAFVERQGNIKEVMLEYQPIYKMDREPIPYRLKLNSDGTVIWSLPEEKMYTREEVYTVLLHAMIDIDFGAQLDVYEGHDPDTNHRQYNNLKKWFNKHYPQ